MRLNAKALMRVAGVRCLYEADGKSRSARVALVTEEAVRDARALAASDPDLSPSDGSPDLRYGEVLAYVDQGSGSPDRLILSPGEGDAFRLPDGTRFLGRHLYDGEWALRGRTDTDAVVVRSGIRSLFGMVTALPHEGRFPPHMVGQAFRYALRTGFGEAQLPVTEEGLAAKAGADLTRARIAEIDPSHPDGLGFAVPLPRLLDRFGLDARSEGVDGPDGTRLTRSDARKLPLDPRFQAPLFGALTRTPANRIEAHVLTLEGLSQIQDGLAASRLTGAWADGVQEIGGKLTGSGSWGYQAELLIYAVEGRDLLLLSDTVGREVGVALLFSWPTRDRAPTLQTKRGQVFALGPEEVPGPEEVIRLRRVLSELHLRQNPVSAPQTEIQA